MEDKLLNYPPCDAELIACDIMMKVKEEFDELGIVPDDVKNYFVTKIRDLENNYSRWIVSFILKSDPDERLDVLIDWETSKFTMGEETHVELLIKFYIWKYFVLDKYPTVAPKEWKAEPTELEVFQSAKEYAVARQDFECASLIRRLQDEIRKENESRV
jgi:hypothetical protein